MKVKKLLPLLALSLVLSSCTNGLSSTSARRKTADYTLLVYMCGSNLESEYANQTFVDGYRWNGRGLATLDLREIISTPKQPKDVNILIETGGSNVWTTNKYGKYGKYDINPEKLQIHRVKKQKIVLDKEMQYASMGESSTLQAFLEYGLKKYPAKRTALVLWNHGGGLQGCCNDEVTNDNLLGYEVIDAVSNALINTGHEGEKLEWIGYDACLMAVQDVAELNSHYFNYMVASEETENGYGWYYTSWIEKMYEHATTPEILDSLCTSFINYYGGTENSQNDQTISWLDLSKMENYKTAFENMAGELDNLINTTNRSSFKSFVNSCNSYGGDYYPLYGLYDVKDFIDKIESEDNVLFHVDSSYTSAVTNALRQLVKKSLCGAGAGPSHGLSMFYAYNGATKNYNHYNDTKTTNFSTWASLVNTYGGLGW